MRRPALNASFFVLTLTAAGTSAPANAAPGASGSIGTSGAEGSTEGAKKKKKKKKDKKKKDKSGKDRGDQKWIKRWAPERNMVELGVFGGVMFPHPRLELFEFDRSLPDFGYQQQRQWAPEVGARLGFYPARMLGLEVEGSALPTQTDAGDSNLIWTARGHLIAQIPRWSVTPFILAGPTGLGVVSDRSAVGNDVDFGFHFGGGLKIFFNRWVGMRLDVRDTLTARRGVGDGVVHSPEFLLGLTFTFNRGRKKAGPGDRDGDGILDPDDKCIDTPGVKEYQGCPIPDSDGDGILDPDDKCVDEPGVEEYDGCPIPDSDGDGILDPDDKCVDEPETVNHFEDSDGCPDEVPEAVKKFTGAIEGIFFDSNRATIKSKSRPKLDKAVKLLKEYDTLRLEVSGHTDSKGNDDHNRDLSERRAAAVKQYMVDAGIESSRLETRGAGEDEPRADNKTRSGRAKNRRIEFKLLD